MRGLNAKTCFLTKGFPQLQASPPGLQELHRFCAHLKRSRWRRASHGRPHEETPRRKALLEELAEMIKHPSSRPPRMSTTARTNCTHDTGMGKLQGSPPEAVASLNRFNNTAPSPPPVILYTFLFSLLLKYDRHARAMSLACVRRVLALVW
ncbi:hypothetical protein GOODEAATRI_006344 [Goodea atripinnis]|uniref:Uncharacterized protein n=1 Tax=Goodea atripinnis TaxID=208336 RepID=A0ABV0PVR8_9TELE